MEKKYKIGFTVGVFDTFHVGHLNLLEKCKEMCDYLIVGICGDDYIKEIKHKTPIYSEADRMRIVGALKCVDKVSNISIEEVENKILALNRFDFNVLFSGDDWKGTERYIKTEKQFGELGVSIEYLPYTLGISTTQIKEKISNIK